MPRTTSAAREFVRVEASRFGLFHVTLGGSPGAEAYRSRYAAEQHADALRRVFNSLPA